MALLHPRVADGATRDTHSVHRNAPAQRRASISQIALASLVGSAIEWYDFFSAAPSSDISGTHAGGDQCWSSRCC
jgi:hypothetical protein